MPATLRVKCTLVQELATAQRAYFQVVPDASIPEEERLGSNGQLSFTVTNVRAPFDFQKGQHYYATLTRADE